jgi:hypothetical protein
MPGVRDFADLRCGCTNNPSGPAHGRFIVASTRTIKRVIKAIYACFNQGVRVRRELGAFAETIFTRVNCAFKL